MRALAPHEFILPILGTFTTDEPEPRLSIVSPWCENESIDNYLLDPKTGDPIRGNQLQRLLSEVAMALCHTHSRGIIHNDINPSDILVTGSGHVQLADFGSSNFVDSSSTNVYAVGGRWGYRSPQKYRHLWQDRSPESYKPTFADDIFAFGTLIYVLYTDCRPFGSGSPFMNHIAAQRMVNGERPLRPSPASCRRAPIPETLWTLVQRCWEDDPSLRPTAKEALHILLTMDNP
jgi:serine/threonine protein kinase